MKISFIIPQYDKPAYMLRECISSIFALSLCDEEREVIIVDDGSTKPFEEALQGYENNVKVIRQENQGLSAARNTGLEIATGDYIQFVDSDDALIPEMYGRVIRKVREKHMDMLMFRFTYDNETLRYDNKIQGTKTKAKTKKLSKCYKGYQFLLHKNLRAAAWCYIFRKDILGDLRFHSGIYHEDALFTPQLIMRVKSLYVLKEKAYFYRQGEGTIMSIRNEQHLQKRLDDSVFVLLELQKQTETMQGEHRQAMQRCIDQQTMCYIYIMMTLKRPLGELRQRVSALKANGLYPLPLKSYTLKYWFFALFTRIIK